jgi:hypothetical protein
VVTASGMALTLSEKKGGIKGLVVGGVIFMVMVIPTQSCQERKVAAQAESSP